MEYRVYLTIRNFSEKTVTDTSVDVEADNENVAMSLAKEEAFNTCYDNMCTIFVTSIKKIDRNSEYHKVLEEQKEIEKNNDIKINLYKKEYDLFCSQLSNTDIDKDVLSFYALQNMLIAQNFNIHRQFGIFFSSYPQKDSEFNNSKIFDVYCKYHTFISNNLSDVFNYFKIEWSKVDENYYGDAISVLSEFNLKNAFIQNSDYNYIFSYYPSDLLIYFPYGQKSEKGIYLNKNSKRGDICDCSRCSFRKFESDYIKFMKGGTPVSCLVNSSEKISKVPSSKFLNFIQIGNAFIKIKENNHISSLLGINFNKDFECTNDPKEATCFHDSFFCNSKVPSSFIRGRLNYSNFNYETYKFCMTYDYIFKPNKSLLEENFETIDKCAKFFQGKNKNFCELFLVVYKKHRIEKMDNFYQFFDKIYHSIVKQLLVVDLLSDSSLLINIYKTNCYLSMTESLKNEIPKYTNPFEFLLRVKYCCLTPVHFKAPLGLPIKVLSNNGTDFKAYYKISRKLVSLNILDFASNPYVLFNE